MQPNPKGRQRSKAETSLRRLRGMSARRRWSRRSRRTGAIWRSLGFGPVNPTARSRRRLRQVVQESRVGESAAENGQACQSRSHRTAEGGRRAQRGDRPACLCAVAGLRGDDYDDDLVESRRHLGSASDAHDATQSHHLSDDSSDAQNAKYGCLRVLGRRGSS